jgi:hypothetical protein
MDMEKGRNTGEDSFTRTAVITLALTFLTCSVSNAGPLAVLSTSPANLSEDVSINTNISVTFDQEIDPDSLYTYTNDETNKEYATNVLYIHNISLSGAGGHSVSYEPLTKTATWTNSGGQLDYGESVTVSVPIRTTTTLPDMEEIKSITGETMAYGYQFSFRVQYDPTPPYVYTAPELIDGDYYMNEKLYFTFSEYVDASTVNSTNIVISDGADIAVGTITTNLLYDELYPTNFYFTPTENLKPNTTYTMTIKKEVTDIGGQSMTSDFTTNFSTNDKSFVQIISSSLGQYDSQVPLDSSITVTFDRPMLGGHFEDRVYIRSDDYDCDVGTSSFATYDSATNSITVTPARDLVLGCYYTLYIDSYIYSTNYEGLEEAYEISFYTGFSHYLNPVPTLSEWGMIIMATAMIGYALTRRETFGSIT